MVKIGFKHFKATPAKIIFAYCGSNGISSKCWPKIVTFSCESKASIAFRILTEDFITAGEGGSGVLLKNSSILICK